MVRDFIWGPRIYAIRSIPMAAIALMCSTCALLLPEKVPVTRVEADDSEHWSGGKLTISKGDRHPQGSTQGG